MSPSLRALKPLANKRVLSRNSSQWFAFIYIRYKVVKFGLKQRKLRKNCSIFPILLKGLKCHHRWELQNLVRFSMICFHLHRVLGGQIWTQPAKIERYCYNLPSLLERLKCQHSWELRILWQTKGSSPETVLNDLLSFTLGIMWSNLDSNSKNREKIAPFSLACLRG